MNKKFALSLAAIASLAFTASAMAAQVPTPTRVPEPGTLGLLVAGIAAAIAVRSIRRK